MLNRINIRITVASLIFIGIAAYTTFEFEKMWNGPQIYIQEPKSGAMLLTPVTEVIGTVRNMSRIRMNDRDIVVDQTGAFREKFALSKGTNMIKVSAEDRFGRHQDTFVTVLYSGPSETLTQR